MLETSTKIPKAGHEDVDILLQTVEDQRRLYYSLDKKVQAAPKVLSPEIFQGPLNSIKDIDGLQCLLICDEEGNLVAHAAKEEVDVNTFYEVAISIHQTTQNSSRQMDIGRFQRGQIEGPFGSIHILVSEGIIYIAFGASEFKADQIYKHLQRFVSKVSFLIK